MMDPFVLKALAGAAHEVSQETIRRIGPNTPREHAAALLAIAESWESFSNKIVGDD